MNKWVLIVTFILSILGAVLNNLINDDPVDWLGSPEVLEMPEGY